MPCIQEHPLARLPEQAKTPQQRPTGDAFKRNHCELHREDRGMHARHQEI